MMGAHPPLALETEQLAAVAAHLLDQRMKLYPAAVEKGSLSDVDAAAGIRIMATIAQDWRRRLALCPPVLDPIEDGWRRYLQIALPDDAAATQAEKLDTLDRAAARAAQLHARKPAADQDDYAACVQALLWWQQPYEYDPAAEPGATSRLDHILSLNHELRRQRAARRAHHGS